MRLGLAAIFMVALALPSAASADAASRAVTQSQAEVRDYWTAERLANAHPASELLAGIPAPNSVLDGLLGAPEPSRRATATAIPDASVAPYRTHGKVVFTLDGVNYQCSGTVVRAKTRRLVATAGHCVYGFGQFATNWMFIPGKEGTAEPYGRWTARRLATTSQWRASEDLRYDVGMVTMRARNRKRLQNVVGARGVAFDKGRSLTFDAFGYPADGFSGTQLYRCHSAAQGVDSGPAPAPTRIDCDMTGGSSGGGWVLGDGRVNSVVSYGYECAILDLLCQITGGNPEEGKLFGPYFGNVVRGLYRSERRRRR